ncbi:MAG: hypothetical protein VB064_12605 [Oscillospiraceae bacterium]|nr:hypothetical protein [Oscillospiraceae bacterium]
MDEKKRIGPLRYLAASKPRISREPVAFFQCKTCGAILSGTLPERGGCELLCCGVKAGRLLPRPAEDLPSGIGLTYDIVGGLNENCVRVFWEGKCPDWLFLETFTGWQHMDIKKRPPAVFALAGEDAYAYCDKDPCEKCSFRCKNGFVLYAWYEGEGLYSLPLNQIAATPGSSGSTTRTPPHNQ